MLILELLIIIALPSKNVNFNKLFEQSISFHFGLNQNVFVCLAAFSLVVFCLYPWKILFPGKTCISVESKCKGNGSNYIPAYTLSLTILISACGLL